MITRLEVDGFKSLRDFAVDLEPLTVFIGPNGAGKSNILEALALLSRLATGPIVDAFKQGRGRVLDQFSRFGGEVGREIRFAVEFLLLDPDDRTLAEDLTGVTPCPSRIRYELTIERRSSGSGAERLLLSHEQLSFLSNERDDWLRQHPQFAALASHGDGETPAPEPSRSARTVLMPDSLKSCQWLRLDLADLAGPSERVDTGTLRPDGSNLPTVLADLPPELVGEIRADLVALVPGLSSFLIVPDADSFRIEFELSGGERLPARLISDGTLRLLALLTALWLEPQPRLIGIEEPETGVYPGRLRALVDLLRARTEASDELGAQILLTTHSSVVLAALRDHPQHLRYIDTVHRDGRRVTRARAVGQPDGETRHRLISLREIDRLLQSISGGGFE